MTLVEQLAAAGIGWPEIVTAECEHYQVPVAYICVLLVKETGGGPDGNIYGHDIGACMSIAGQRIQVTEANYGAYLACVAAGGKRNGVGPLQLTFAGYQRRADELGGCWRPEVSIRVGVEAFAQLLQSSDSLRTAFRRYNGGTVSTPRSEAYADDAMARLPYWQRVVEEAAMTRMPGVPFLGVTGNGTMNAWDIVCVHTIVGYQGGGNAAHFTTGATGGIVQARDTGVRSAANLNGNWHIIAIENEDHGPAYGWWDTDNGHAAPPFTAAQCEAVARILVWCHRTHGIPLVLVPDSKVGRRGIAYHRQGIDGNWAGYAYGGRVAGGELWSSVTGKVCPGDRRIRQLIDVIIPRARVLAGLDHVEGFMVALNDAEQRELLDAVRACRHELTLRLPYRDYMTDPALPGDTMLGNVLNAAARAAELLKEFRDYRDSGGDGQRAALGVAQAGITDLQARPAFEVDATALATALAPLLADRLHALPDDALTGLVQAIANEQDRRARDADPATGPSS